MAERDYTPYQREVIRRYYANLDTIARQRLAELVSAAFLADAKQAERIWRRVESALKHLKLPEDVVQEVVGSRDPERLARLVEQLCR
jgi:hypothetical protein